MSDEPERGGTGASAAELRAGLAIRPDPEAAARQLLAGESWDTFCDRLREAGAHVLASGANRSPAERAEGFDYLLGLVRGGLGQALELADPDRPRFFRNPDSSARWGAENADNQYLWARIRPDARYRILGTRGSAFDFLVEVKEGYMQLGDERNFATLTAHEIRCDADGRFAIELSSEAPGGGANWLPLDPDARYVAIRQFLCDWEGEAPARFTIERIEDDAPAPPDIDLPADLARRIADAGDWVVRTARFFSEWPERVRALHESVEAGRLAPARKFAGGADAIYYGLDLFRLGPDEALVIESELPRARYWQFQLCDLWFRSADWSRRQTSLNLRQARLDADGRVRCVVAHRDPGVPNWLDTGGRPEGLIQYRWIWSDTNPQPSAVVVPVSRVREHLPPETPHVSPEQRRAALRARAAHRDLREPVC